MPLSQVEQSSLNNVNRGRGLVIREAHSVRPVARRRHDTHARLAAFESSNPVIVQPNLQNSTFYWLYILAMVGAYLLDRALFSQALEELAAQALPSIRY